MFKNNYNVARVCSSLMARFASKIAIEVSYVDTGNFNFNTLSGRIEESLI